MDKTWSATQKVWLNQIMSKCTNINNNNRGSSNTSEFIIIEGSIVEQHGFKSTIDELELNLNLTNDQSKLKIIQLRDWFGIKKALDVFKSEFEAFCDRAVVLL